MGIYYCLICTFKVEILKKSCTIMTNERCSDPHADGSLYNKSVPYLQTWAEELWTVCSSAQF